MKQIEKQVGSGILSTPLAAALRVDSDRILENALKANCKILTLANLRNLKINLSVEAFRNPINGTVYFYTSQLRDPELGRRYVVHKIKEDGTVESVGKPRNWYKSAMLACMLLACEGWETVVIGGEEYLNPLSDLDVLL